MSLLFRIIGGLCVATVLTQSVVLGVCAARGTLDGNTAFQIVALLNGIDITGQRLRMALERQEGWESPSFDDILDERARQGLEMDLRLDAQTRMAKELEERRLKLRRNEEQFDERRQEFFDKLDEIRAGVQQDGMQELTRTIQALDSEQAKKQLMKMIDADRIEDVVNIIQATPLDKRTDILAEFTTPDEEDQLAEILRRIGQGEPASSLIDRAAAQ